MKILLDENMPESLVSTLKDLGHEVDSVNHLRLKGLDNGTLYRQVVVQYDICFTRDAGFAQNVRQDARSFTSQGSARNRSPTAYRIIRSGFC
jgi:hypothetical protein